MKVLGIETSSNIGSVAICDGDAVTAEQSFEEGMLHEKELMPALKSAFEKSCLKPKDIDLISVSVGPGSYTGLRVGITCAKTVSYALKKPVIDVSSMDVIAQNVRVEHKCICPVIDAKREMVYACIYEYSPDNQMRFRSNVKHNLPALSAKDESMSINLWKRVSELLIISPDEVINRLPEGTLVFGDGVPRYVKIFEKRNLLIGNDDIGIPKAYIVAILGRHAYKKGRRRDINALKPIYLQKPEATERLQVRKDRQ